ncbi:hypothetical protein CT0861_03491 [Colletotrichum tofieldiae]|uniref:Actin-like ATPase domain-containing protein n=1 Tax=Colletotrichum tofieldiae TaxID=708197 RepID=A0A166TQU8_9PEZI|nr:hypothetical protein CT0861_03491 [Colletotrichum tofieldiae]
MVARHRVSIEDTILGIDLGSTSTRVCLWCPKRRQENIDIENTENTGKVPLGDFPSVGYPFESEGPVYLGDTVDPTRRPISLKYGFYALAEADKRDDLLKQYVLVTPLTAQRENPAFRDRLRQGLRELFLTLQKRIDFTCDLYRLRIKTIGISVPSQWTTDFENVYRELIISVFKDSDDISFHTETEALAHALLRNHQIALPEYGENITVVSLTLSMGKIMMQAFIESEIHLVGYRAGGGSEQWSYHVGEQFAKIFSLMRGRSMTSEEWKTFTDQFDNCKPSLGPGTCDGRLKVGGWDMTLPSAYIDDCFERSHTHVFQKANEYIKLVSEIHGATPYVIVSGGTAKHKTVQSRLRNMCKEHGIKEPLFSNEWSITHGSGRIARGVAYAAGSRLTFDQFLQRGAAFGIQRKQKASRGDPNSSEEWNNVADLLFCKVISTFGLQAFLNTEELI